MIERSFGQFYMTPSGDRRCTKQKVGSGVEKTPQREYSELLKPSYKVSCKRQVYDPGYLRLPDQGEGGGHCEREALPSGQDWRTASQWANNLNMPSLEHEIKCGLSKVLGRAVYYH
ncbi:hypothetical protein FIBSPDRAFT_900779 [Athelia psychrophila]|uniref:Uncharacterized protein n=1 Tax=Athelia psychrophila TaxID=1759441 RepID=A0A165XZW8_9AGAM|nr:hypothetical protein FIBSPDRAFT_900779 [Fibularhizoctonia sp. CBS 109695]